MKDYRELTKADLIQRLQTLEAARGAAPEPGETDAIKRERLNRAALHDSEERLRAILETAVEGILTIDEHGTIETVNSTGARLFGYEPADLVGQNVRVLMPSPYRQEHDTYLANYRATGEAKVIGIGREVTGRRRNGEEFPVDLAVSEAHLTAGRRFVGFVRDISARKQAEQRTLAALKEVTNIKAALDEHSIVAITDAAGRITNVNDKFCAISKYPREELLGQDHRLINSGHHPKAFFRDLWTTIAQGRVWHGEIRNRAKDGSFYWVDTTIYPFLDDAGQPVQYVAIRTDITARKAHEERLARLAHELAEKNKELEAIVYVASHDLRSPLVNVQGFSKELARACQRVNDLLDAAPADAGGRRELRELLAADVPEALSFIQAGVAKMDELLSGFLRYSRLGRVALRPEPLDMNTLLRNLLKTMDFEIKRLGAVVAVDDLPPCHADATQVGQVFANLLDNALKYRDPRRPGRVRVSGTPLDGEVRYAVADNGIGVAPEHQAKIFEIYHRLNPAASPGEGLGLTIARKLLERQAGRIVLESAAGQGSTFFVFLPTNGR